MEDVFDELDRARRVEHRARLPAEVADLREHAVKMDRRGRLRLDEEMVGAGASEFLEIALRLDDHQMHIERLLRGAPHRLDDDRPEGDVRHEAPVHDIDMDPVRAGLVDGKDFLAEPLEIGGEDRRGDDDRTHRRLGGARGRAVQDEPLNRFCKALVVVGVGDAMRLPLDLVAGIAHGDTEAALAEHQHVVRHVADGGDPRGGDGRGRSAW